MQFNDFEIIDFHTHPFSGEKNNICAHAKNCDMSIEQTVKMYDRLGVSKFCGSVLTFGAKREEGKSQWEQILEDNKTALELQKAYGGRYIPGFHVHPDYVDESIEEMHKMNEAGVKLVGEICPYIYGWSDYSCEGFSRILDEAESLNMVVSIHSMGEDEMDKMVKAHPSVTIVAAHPGEFGSFMRHVERMKMSENYYLDISGYGLFRHGMLRRAMDEFGAHRILFGSDYPTCNPSMYIGGVLLDELITDEEKELIFSGNAKRLLGIE